MATSDQIQTGSKGSIDTDAVISKLNSILELELASVVRYTHYSFMVFGHSRIPIISWLRGQATEALGHAHEAGEHITTLGGHPPLNIGPLLQEHKQNIDDILRETLEHERKAIYLYEQLLGLVENRSVALEEYTRRMINLEEADAAEIEKMLR